MHVSVHIYVICARSYSYVHSYYKTLFFMWCV